MPFSTELSLSKEKINFVKKIQEILIRKNQTLAILEHFTKGLLYHSLSQNEERHLRGGMICPNNASLYYSLNIPAQILLKENQLQKGYLLAQKIRSRLSSNIGLATTGIKAKTYQELHVTIGTETEQSHKIFKLKDNNTIIEATLGTLYFFLSTRL